MALWVHVELGVRGVRGASWTSEAPVPAATYVDTVCPCLLK
jgi:hypothetical protein